MADINWPENHNVQGMMTFPIWDKDQLPLLKEWRERKNLPKPRYPDRIGFGLFLNEAQHNKVVDNLLKVYLPFAATLKKESGGSKGVDPALVKSLTELVKKEDWSGKNFPLRALSDKDEQNLAKNGIEGVVSKIKVLGPPDDAAIKIKAIASIGNNDAKIVSLDDVEDRTNEQDWDALWAGAGWPFRTAVRWNVYDTRDGGVSAYVRNAFLLADRPLPVFGADEAAVLAEGDDWEED